ncbi:MAG: hypothetical protein R2797_04700 [Gelidibacter sp.]
MKKYRLTILIVLLISKLGFTQEYEIIRETKTIIETRDMYLNGGANASLGGKSRTYIKIDLPPNTVQWYYSFNTTPGQSGSSNLNLALQLSARIADPTFLTSGLSSGIKVPEGVAKADVYLLNFDNLNLFIQKADLNGQRFRHYPEGLAENTKQAVVKIDDIKTGTWYLGIKNPSTFSGINLNIEVVAITETRVLKKMTAEEEKAALYTNLGWTKFESGDYEKCIEYCDKANEISQIGIAYANKGLAQLMLGEESEAMETYIQAILVIKKQPNSAQYLSSAIQDIDDALVIKPDLSGAQEIRQVLVSSK